ncbi:polysaccharide biosynthesis protein [Vibrio sp. T187]|uniref:lipopolysaccharide biosynthesis protein n=1 Tax=Vibrio TaxID=662 RepID=UPI0010C9E302|nr:MULTISPECIES: oligosaccharide flippase family protein [Vibrio]MBW3697569.1 polysaccharide biosynthesis protein [Vibrio sp. T187]
MNSQSSLRTNRYLLQIKGSFLFKTSALVLSFLVIPLMISYLGNEVYGIWSTLLSVLAWLVMFDIGIGNGLRNKLSESISNGDYLEAREYISTTYAAITIITLVIFCLFYIFTRYADWSVIFNTNLVDNKTLELAVSISVFFVLLNFILSTINQVLNATQQTNIVVLGQLIANLVLLPLIVILARYTKGDIVYLSITYGVSLFLSNMFLTIWFYKNNVIYRPSLKLIKKTRLSNTMQLGGKFFVIQIAVLVLFTTDRLIITQLLGPEQVVAYDVAFRLFSIVTVFYSLVSAPLWNSYSDAYNKQDYTWIRSMLKKQLNLFLLIVLGSSILALFMPLIIYFWIGATLVVSGKIIFLLLIFTLLQVWNNIFAMILNGLSETSLQIKTSIIAALVNIPISYILVQYVGMGVDGIILGSVISVGLFSLFGPYECYRVLYRKKNE